MRQFFWIILAVGLVFLVGCRNEPAAENIQLPPQQKIDPNPKATGTGWMSDLVGNDEPPAVFRGLKMGDQEAKFEMVPGLHRVEPDSGDVYYRIDSVNGIGGDVFLNTIKGRLCGVEMNFGSANPALIVALKQFLVQRIAQNYHYPNPPTQLGSGNFAMTTGSGFDAMDIVIQEDSLGNNLKLAYLTGAARIKSEN